MPPHLSSTEHSRVVSAEAKPQKSLFEIRNQLILQHNYPPTDLPQKPAQKNKFQGDSLSSVGRRFLCNRLLHTQSTVSKTTYAWRHVGVPGDPSPSPGEVVDGSMGGVCAPSREDLSPSDGVEAVPLISLNLTCCLSSPGCAAAHDVHPWMRYSPASLPQPLLLPGSLNAFAPSLPGIILTFTCIFLARSQVVPEDGLCLGILAFVHVIMSVNICLTRDKGPA